jgi:hypothetical protein
LIKNSFVATFDRIYDEILHFAKKGDYEHHFTIMCQELPDENCTTFNLLIADLYYIILPLAELFLYKRKFIGYKVTLPNNIQIR